jgi:hypothetical protein
VDLSGIIFVGLAVAWAVYLIPKALRHHDEMARSRPVDRFSHTMRVLGRGGSSTTAAPEPQQATPPAPQRETAKPRTRHTVTRSTARRAAARRRRVLGLLLVVTAAVAVLAWRALVPYWSIAIPAALVVTFLVVARITVRRERSRVAAAETVAEQPDGDADTEDTVEVSRDELAAAVAAPATDAAVLEDGGSLWDPLPLTLPTYVHKARARRTVRTIELTQTDGVTSSGHDAADSALVAAAADEAATPEETAEQRRVAGA